MANESNSASKAPQPTDHVDDLFDYNVGLDDILQDINTNPINTNPSSTAAPKQSAPPDNAGVVLGLDEEVKVVKKRQPVAKLDENRLLTQAGIPKLRRSARKNLKFRGKGHEFSDLARLLNFYQLWLDDLFPRAKFADGLAMIERLGHSKRIQTMRRAWIDEEKPKPAEEDILNPSDHREMSSKEPVVDTNHASRTSPQLDDADEDLFMPDSNNNQIPTNGNAGAPDDDDFDELDALLRAHRDEPDIGKTTSNKSDDHASPPEEDDLDELDVLLREHEGDPNAGNSALRETNKDTLETDSHADELEAMERLGGFGN
ncbi:Chromosome segregation in meiosis protein 3 [Aspergillus undulatus]|uniref:Chromosome segregation in meiosis protein 3 n=1 Tax=Aspergillus undulatus TaxID=1810928 RepID=UPI003CCCF1C7